MLRENLPILVELVLVGGGALGFGLWQLRSIKRDRAAMQARRAAEAAAAQTKPAEATPAWTPQRPRG